MLTEADIQEVLDKFSKLEQMRASKQKNEGRTGVSDAHTPLLTIAACLSILIIPNLLG
jgi:hypothetical protein